MSRLTQLYDLLTEHGGTLSYAALGAMMQQTGKELATTMSHAAKAGMARNVAPRGHGSTSMAQLYPDATRPVDARIAYQKEEARQALALLAEHPSGLDKADIGALLGWSYTSVTRCMTALDQCRAVQVNGGTRTTPKVYTLPGQQAAARPVPRPVLAPQARPLPTRQDSIDTAGLTGALLSAARILNALSSDKRADPRYLACQGGYSYTRARELHAEIMRRAG